MTEEESCFDRLLEAMVHEGAKVLLKEHRPPHGMSREAFTAMIDAAKDRP